MAKITKTIDRNASPSAYGWYFQVGAGISLMLDYIKSFTKLKMEGRSDDIEITLDTKQKIYAQAKSVTQIGYQKTASKNLTDALKVLSEDELKGDAVKLIYITNISNPLSSSNTSAFEYGGIYDFSILSEADKKNITDKIRADFPTNKFQIQIIRFFGEADNKFQKIKEKIAEFLRTAIDDPSHNVRLLENWFETFMINASDKPNEEKEINLTKRQVIFTVIAVIINPVTEADFYKVCDYENYDEITQEYRKIISENICNYEFTTQILADYREKKKKADNNTYKYDFTKNEWQNYENKFTLIPNKEKREALIKILLLTIITNNAKIQSIKTAANL
jgi:hypothetical protein